jgi:hypothetical protein
MQLIEQMGIFPDRYVRERKPKLKSVIHAVIAAVRMRKLQQGWLVNKVLKETLASSLELARKEAARIRRSEEVVV